MAVFEYRGLVVATGKQVHGFRDADNPKVLRSALKREGVMLTSADLDKRGQGGKSRSGGGVFAFFRRIGPAAPRLRALPENERAGAESALRALLERRRVGTRVCFDAMAWIVSARAPGD